MNTNPGNYYVTISSNVYSECIDTLHFILNDTSQFEIGASAYDYYCQSSNDGYLSFTAVDYSNLSPIPNNGLATNPVNYTWIHGDSIFVSDAYNMTTYTGPQILNIPIGLFILEATDGNGCWDQDSANVEITFEPYVTIQDVQIAYCQLSNGSATLICHGLLGQQQWSTSINGITYQSTDSVILVEHIGSGNYLDTALSSIQGCFATYELEIPHQNIDYEETIIAPSCTSGEGLIYIEMTPSNLDYSYEWSTTDTSNLIIANDYGTYSVTITSLDSCYIYNSFTIDSVANPILETIPINLSCEGVNNGSILTNVVYGMSPFSFVWSTGDTSTSIDSLSLGSYVVTMTDAYGCTDLEFVEMHDLFYFDFYFDITKPTCRDNNNDSIAGSIGVSAFNGFPQYSYLWSTGDSTVAIDSLGTGFYSVTVIDSIGCILIDSAFIPQQAITMSFDITGQGCNGLIDTSSLQNGSVLAYPTSGTSPYSYAWDSGDTTNNLDSLTDLTWHTLTITDQNSCAGTDSVMIQSEQTIVIPEGWSMLSTYIDIGNSTNLLVGQYFEANGLAQKISIMKNYQGNVYWPLYNLDFIEQFVKSEGYQIKMNIAESWLVEGKLICPEDEVINLNSGWSIRPYTRTTVGSIASLLDSITAAPFTTGDLELVKNWQGQIFWPYYGLNNIDTMCPGAGYQFNMNNAANLRYTSNSSNYGTKRTTSNSASLSINSNTYVTNTGNSMIIGIPLSSWETQPNIGDDIIIVGERNQVAGHGAYNGGFIAIVVYGDDITTPYDREGLSSKESFSIAIRSTKTNTVKKLDVKSWEKGDEFFEENKVSVTGLSDIAEPALIEIVSLQLQVVPNPTVGEFMVKLKIDDAFSLKLSIYNNTGQLVLIKELNGLRKGLNEIYLDLQDYAGGAYHIIVHGNSHIGTAKAIIIK
jgi:hypothetical protein